MPVWIKEKLFMRCNIWKKLEKMDLCKETARLISEDKITGWFQERMEWEPRALGNRSILADPRNPETQKKLNLKIKYREDFRPFAPSVQAEKDDGHPTAKLHKIISDHIWKWLLSAQQ